MGGRKIQPPGLYYSNGGTVVRSGVERLGGLFLGVFNLT